MALKPCKDCGKEISTSADPCPHCGKKNPTGMSKALIGIINITWISFFIYLMVSSSGVDVKQGADGFSTLSLNVREQPSTDYDVVTVLEKGEQVKFLKDSVGWKKIRTLDDKTVGWASGKYLKSIDQLESWTEKQEDQQVEQEQKKQGYQIDKAGAWVATQTFVKRRLKSPSSASFPWSFDDRVTYLGNKEYAIQGYVDSQNSFGAEFPNVHEKFLWLKKEYNDLIIHEAEKPRIFELGKNHDGHNIQYSYTDRIRNK